MSAKTEFLRQIQGRGLICAKLEIERRDPPDYFPYFKGVISYIAQDYILKQGYTDLELRAFLESIDFEYGGRSDCRELKLGLIWHTDKTWSERCECDGTEWWEFREIPVIPVELLQSNIEVSL